MDNVIDDDTTASVFRTLSDPAALELLVHALSSCRHEVRLATETPTPRQDASHLAALVDAGLLTRGRESGGEVYRVTDPVGLELLLRTARQLGTDRGAW